jgi:hypothetical protein
MSYVYIQSEPGLYTVGHYDPQGRWHPDSDHNSRGEAGDRAAYLNGNPIKWPSDTRAKDEGVFGFVGSAADRGGEHGN